LNTFYQNLKGKVFIDYTHLKQSSAPTKTTTSVNQKPSAKLPETTESKQIKSAKNTYGF